MNELFGSEADRLIQELFEAPDWLSRFVTLDNLLLPKFRRSEQPSNEIRWAWRRLDLSHGAIPIQQITGAYGSIRPIPPARRSHSARIWSQIGAVRRSCKTIAWKIGSPV